jgi:collagen type VII alpha
MRKGWPSIALLSALLALPLGGCEGCLDLEEYSLVRSDGSSSGGSSGSSGSSTGGSGATGGSTDSCGVAGFAGAVYAVFAASAPGPADGACAPEAGTGPGVELVALDPADGACIARTRIVAGAQTRFEASPRVEHALDDVVVVAGTFRDGPLDFPPECGSGSAQVLEPATGARDSLFVARLRREDTAFCTDWTRRAGTEETRASALRVHDVRAGDDGSVAVAGGLGGALVRFDEVGGTRAVTGGAFVAVWSMTGTLRTVTALASRDAADDRAFSVDHRGSSWLASGSALIEDPACHACAGSSYVTERANVCAVDGAGGAAGADAAGGGAGVPIDAAIDVDDASGGSAGSGGVAGSSGAPGFDASSSDTLNAFIAVTDSGGCARFESFGSDRDASDVQAAFDISHSTRSCGAYVTGLAGVGAWPLDAVDGGSAMAPGDDAVADGFLARFAGGQTVGCGAGGPSFALRFSSPGGTIGERVAAARCSEEATALAFVRGAAGQTLELELCRPGAGCDAQATTATLGQQAIDQLAVLGVGADGALAWHAAFGPVALEATTPGDPFGARARADLTLDQRDNVYLLLETRDALQSHNLETSECEELADAGAASGIVLISLLRGGTTAQGQCHWARRL